MEAKESFSARLGTTDRMQRHGASLFVVITIRLLAHRAQRKWVNSIDESAVEPVSPDCTYHAYEYTPTNSKWMLLHCHSDAHSSLTSVGKPEKLRFIELVDRTSTGAVGYAIRSYATINGTVARHNRRDCIRRLHKVFAYGNCPDR